METKLIEIRDRNTMIIALCVDMNPKNEVQKWALRRYGFHCNGRPSIMLTHANGGHKANNDPYDWCDRTYSTAHHYITENWATLYDGDVVDVEYILGETNAPKISEVQSKPERNIQEEMMDAYQFGTVPKISEGQP